MNRLSISWEHQRCLTNINGLITGAVYSVKLRLEFAILNQLIAIASAGLHTNAAAGSVTAGSHSRLAACRASTSSGPHPGAQELHLQTFDRAMIISQNGKDVIGAHTRPPSSAKKSYSAFVAVGAPAKPRVEYVGEGCVVTTEVDVQGSSLSIVGTDDEEDEIVERRGNGKV